MAHSESALFDYCVALPIMTAVAVGIGLPLEIITNPANATRFVRQRFVEPTTKLAAKAAALGLAATLLPHIVLGQKLGAAIEATLNTWDGFFDNNRNGGR